MTVPASITARDLTKVFRLYDGPAQRLLEALHPLRRKLHTEFAALDGLTFTIPRGETVAFIGKNGSGKSTLLKTITGRSGMSGSTVARLEGRHRAVAGNALRAAVLGANDGLLSNFSLIMGVAGADQSGRSILIAGLAGLMAGAGSMALGEWISV